MKLEIDFLSTEVVTPSSPTPPHLNRYKLSLLDQMMPSFFMPTYYFYPANNQNQMTSNNNSQKSNHLKKSLSQTLTLYYPLAGRLVGNYYVNCNDEGVNFIHAQVNCKLLDVITDALPDELIKLVPSCDPPNDGKDHCCLAVQATFFNCGGLAIGITISHKLVDGLSNFMFFNSWAAISRGDSNAVQFPKFESAVHFPPIDLGSRLNLVPIEKKENIITKRFVFTAQKIADLRQKYCNTKKNTNDEGLKGPSRTEILTAFIWTRFMVSTGAKDDVSKVYDIRVFVDIRTRVVPPLSEYHFGNIVLPAITVPSLNNDEDRTHGMVKKLRDAIRNVDSDYTAIKNRVENALEGDVVMFKFSSLSKFPVYMADFGWGIPVWFGVAKFPRSNIVMFGDTFSGGGIDAWVNLKVEDMAKFEVDEELLEYTSSQDDAKLQSRI